MPPKGYKCSPETNKKHSIAMINHYKNHISPLLGKKRDPKIVDKIRKSLKGKFIREQASNWAGDNVGKIGIHFWLRKNFGHANRCEGIECSGKSKTFHWANLNNHKYRRIREDYKMLCRSCHFKLDYANGRNRPYHNIKKGWEACPTEFQKKNNTSEVTPKN